MPNTAAHACSMAWMLTLVLNQLQKHICSSYVMGSRAEQYCLCHCRVLTIAVVAVPQVLATLATGTNALQ